MSLALEKKFKELLAEAKYLEKEDMVSASNLYLKSADVMDALSESTFDTTLRNERIKLAQELRKHAGELKKGKNILKISEPLTPESEHTKYIREHIMQKNKDNLPSWNDIGGLEEVKNLIKKSVVIGIIENKPKAIEAWNAILFYGPPGTGKTLLAAAVAKNINASFFNVKVSQMLSKYYGESPKIMSALFKVARTEAPSVIFIDEFDSIALSRGGDIDEETRRGLSTLLAELDGLSSKASKEFVLVIVATNTPEAIDSAIMSRFGKKIEIPLPDKTACKEIIKIHTEIKGIKFERDFYDELAEYCLSKKMSGRDIKFMCINAIWNMLDEMNPKLEKLADEPYETIRAHKLKLRELKKEDFKLENL